MDEPRVTWHPHHVSRADRRKLNGHPGCVVWFTGLSGCGKSTLANAVDHRLFQLHVHSYVLDGDNLRHGLNASPSRLAAYGDPFAQRFGLGFASEDRRENLRRVGAVARLFSDAGFVTLAAFVSPYRADRQSVRQEVEALGGTFIEAFVDASLATCEGRDPKGLYKQARAGEIPHFTGIDDPYERPESPDLHLAADRLPPDTLAQQVVDLLDRRGLLGSPR